MQSIKVAALVIALGLLFVPGLSGAQGLRFSSNKHQYSFAVPTGWSQIPDGEIARLKAERLPPQAQHLIYETAFQGGFKGTWFEWPYVIVQVIPADRTKLRRLPTEAEFEQFVRAITGGKFVEKAREAIASTPSAEDRKMLESSIASLSSATVQVDVSSRKYWFTTDLKDPAVGPLKGYIAGIFLPNGNVVQLNAYSRSNRFSQDIKHFLEIYQSLRSGSPTSEVHINQ